MILSSAFAFPGGGITKTLYEESYCEEIQMAVLLKFVSEGDNIPDAVSLVEYLNEWLQLTKPSSPTASALTWKIPSSWWLLVAVDFLPHCSDLFSAFSLALQRSQNRLLGVCCTEFFAAPGCVISATVKPRRKEVVKVVMLVIYNKCKYCTINYIS